MEEGWFSNGKINTKTSYSEFEVLNINETVFLIFQSNTNEKNSINLYYHLVNQCFAGTVKRQFRRGFHSRGY